MTVKQAILQRLQVLPDAAQQQVLEFVLSLQPGEGSSSDHDVDGMEWGEFSIGSAMSGMEDEPSPYSPNDIKEHY